MDYWLNENTASRSVDSEGPRVIRVEDDIVEDGTLETDLGT